MNYQKILALFIIISLSSGCVSKRLQEKVYGVKPDHNQIYGVSEVRDSDRVSLPPRTPGIQPDLANVNGYNRVVLEENNDLFPRLENPAIVIHFNPRINSAGFGVPGFDTAVMLYERNHYVAPNEWYGFNTLRNSVEQDFLRYPDTSTPPHKTRTKDRKWLGTFKGVDDTSSQGKEQSR